MKSLVEKVLTEMDVDKCEGKQASAGLNSVSLMSESLEELQKSIENDFQEIHVEWEDIFNIASRANKSTGGGLCQLTPRHVRSAILDSAGNKCAEMLAHCANR